MAELAIASVPDEVRSSANIGCSRVALDPGDLLVERDQRVHVVGDDAGGCKVR